MKREVEIKTAILRKLAKTPAKYATTQEHLLGDVRLLVHPEPSRTEMENALRELDALCLISGVTDDYDGQMRWVITTAGKLELSLR